VLFKISKLSYQERYQHSITIKGNLFILKPNSSWGKQRNKEIEKFLFLSTSKVNLKKNEIF
jgi:hypothetical protein